MAIKIEDLENLTKLTDEEASQISGGYTFRDAWQDGNAIGTAIYDAFGTQIVDGIEWLENGRQSAASWLADQFS